MLQVDASLFANVSTTLQRTRSLTGGAVRGLPNGVVLEGLHGVSGFGSDITEAQKEFELGRVRSSLERIKQIEMQFNGIAGRWNSTASGILSSARQGQQKVSIQKLNEVKAAQTKMQQLTNPAIKALRDLVSALEHAVTQEGHQENERRKEPPDHAHVPPQEHSSSISEDGVLKEALSTGSEAQTGSPDTPSTDLLGRFASHYGFGQRLKIIKNQSGKSSLRPAFQNGHFYLLAGAKPPRVVRVRELNQSSLVVYDTRVSAEILIEMNELKDLLHKGIWELVKS